MGGTVRDSVVILSTKRVNGWTVTVWSWHLPAAAFLAIVFSTTTLLVIWLEFRPLDAIVDHIAARRLVWMVSVSAPVV